MKCRWCKKELKLKDVVLSSNMWIYCKNCKKPILDYTIQPEENYFKKNRKKLETDSEISLMLKGYM